MLTPRRGLLLVYGAMVFGDTSNNVDEEVHVFFVYIQRKTECFKHFY